MSGRNNNKRTKEIFREWLEKLQQESWQLELLISGLALFGIWESRSLIDNFDDYLDLNATGLLTNYLKSFLLFLRVSWVIFFINLLIHIIIRGLWIGAIGLRYVSGDIDYRELNYSQRFETFLRKNVGDFDDYIEKLEKLSSIIFSFTFLLMFFFLSVICIIFIFGLLFQISSQFTDQPQASLMGLVMGLFLLLLFVFIDFISFGSLKRIDSPIFSKVYYWVYRFVGFLTLSFLYRPLLYNFIDDKYTKRLVIIAIPYIIFVSIIIPSFGFDAYNYIPSFTSNHTYSNKISERSFNYIYYDDLREKYARQHMSENRNPIIDWVSLDAYEYNQESLAKIFFHSSTFEDETFEKRFPHLVPFREKGFYSIFNSNKRKNEYLDSIKTAEVAELTFMRKILRGQIDKITDDEKSKFGNKLEYYQRYDETSLKTLNSEIHDEYVKQREDYYDSYLDQLLAAKQSLISMKIDSTEMVDSLDCSFFINPNMGEQGILCYFPISSFDNGKHDVSISIEHAYKEEDQDDSWYTYKKFPFIINRNIK